MFRPILQNLQRTPMSKRCIRQPREAMRGAGATSTRIEILHPHPYEQQVRHTAKSAVLTKIGTLDPISPSLFSLTTNAYPPTRLAQNASPGVNDQLLSGQMNPKRAPGPHELATQTEEHMPTQGYTQDIKYQ
jgi:hypothetical protein